MSDTRAEAPAPRHEDGNRERQAVLALFCAANLLFFAYDAMRLRPLPTLVVADRSAIEVTLLTGLRLLRRRRAPGWDPAPLLRSVCLTTLALWLLVAAGAGGTSTAYFSMVLAFPLLLVAAPRGRVRRRPRGSGRPRGRPRPAPPRRRERGPAAGVGKDSGPGLSEEAKARLFEPSFTTKGSKGTGLGLAISRENLERCGGTLEAASGRSGGALFVASIPVAQ